MLLSCPHGQVSVCILLLEVWKQRLRDDVSRSSSHTCWDGIARTVFCWGCCCLQNRKIITDSAGLCGLPCLSARHKQFRSLYAPKWIHSENKIRFFCMIKCWFSRVLLIWRGLLQKHCFDSLLLKGLRTFCIRALKWRKNKFFENNNGKSFPKKWVHFPMETVIRLIKEMISSPYLKLKAFLVLSSSGKQYLTYANSFIYSWIILELQSIVADLYNLHEP